MNLLIYIYYRLIRFYDYEKVMVRQRIYAYINLCAILILHQLTLGMFVDSIFHINILTPFNTDNGYYNRFIATPIITAPLCIITYLYYQFNKEKVNNKLKEFRHMTSEEEKPWKRKFWIYIIITLLLFIAGFTSSSYIRV